jgi:fatty-acyl-CoA synthase
LGPNHPSFLVSLFATAALGAIFVPLDPRLAEPEVLYRLSDSGAGVLVHAGTSISEESTASVGVRHRLDVRNDPREREPGGFDPDSSEQVDAGSHDAAVSLDEPCMIMYTSGSGGRSKGAVLTHGNIVWNAFNVLVDSDLSCDDVTLAAAPLFHAAALNMTCLPTLLKGGTVVLTVGFDAGTALGLIEREHVTHMFGVPAMFAAMADHPHWNAADLSSLRLLNCGGAPVPMPLIRTYLGRGLPFGQGYGATEAGPGILMLGAAAASAKPGSAGTPHFFTEFRIAGPDGNEVASGDLGEVLVAGPNVAAGYWARPDETNEAFTPAGWFHTGDVARLDEDGYAYIVGRIKDMYISGGENVYPAEVEKVLSTHPSVAECAVFGVSDPKWGEVGRAVVVLRPDSEPDGSELTAYLRQRLAAFKLPKSYIFVPELPRTGSGKIAKHLVRASHGSAQP